MRKKISLTAFFIALYFSGISQEYVPTQENIAARQQFRDNRYGMFIHWGLSSILADGEWVMNNRNIKVEDYKRLLRAFNPVDFDAAKWVSAAKNAGMNISCSSRAIMMVFPIGIPNNPTGRSPIHLTEKMC
jgi:alpha-L-fucosidase